MTRRCLAMISPLFLSVLIVAEMKAQARYQTIDTERLHAMVVDNAYKLEAGRTTQYTIIDTRAPEVCHEGSILSSINVQPEDFQVALAVLPRDHRSPIVLYGEAANNQPSHALLDKLTAAGYTSLYFYPESYTSWKERNLPVAQKIDGTP